MRKCMVLVALVATSFVTSGCAATAIGKYDQVHTTYNNVAESGMDYVESYKRNHQLSGSEVKAACEDDSAGELQKVCQINASVIKSGPIIRQGSRLMEKNQLEGGEVNFLKLATDILNENIDLIVDYMSGG